MRSNLQVMLEGGQLRVVLATRGGVGPLPDVTFSLPSPCTCADTAGGSKLYNNRHTVCDIDSVASTALPPQCCLHSVASTHWDHATQDEWQAPVLTSAPRG